MPNYLDIVRLVEALISSFDAFNHHGPRVSVLAMEFAQRAGLTMHEIEMMGVSGSLHDIGKLVVDDHVLNLPRALSVREYAKVKPHAREGWRLLSQLDYDPIILDVVLHHHENWDGSGYPDGLHGMQISPYARMMRIVDSYDAITNVRPHRAPRSHEEAFEEMMRFSGTWFDHELARLFFEKVAHG